MNAYNKFSNGTYFIWFPVLNTTNHRSILKLQNHFDNTLVSYFAPEPKAEKGLQESGILIINPPWGLKETLNGEFKALAARAFPKLKYSFVENK